MSEIIDFGEKVEDNREYVAMGIGAVSCQASEVVIAYNEVGMPTAPLNIKHQIPDEFMRDLPA